MFLFYVTEPLDLTIQRTSNGRRAFVYEPALPAAPPRPSAERFRLQPAVDGTVTGDTLYFGFSRFLLERLATFTRQIRRPVVRLLSRQEQMRVLSHPFFPVRLGHGTHAEGVPCDLASQVEKARLGESPRIAILNPFGFALGDTIVFLTALREFCARMTEQLGPFELNVFQHPDNLDTEELYVRSGLSNAIHHLPAPVRLLAEYDAYVDLTVRFPSRGLPWVDEMLQLLAIDPATVSPERKRNALTVRPSIATEVAHEIARLKAIGTPIVLIHHRASTPVRSIPDALIAMIIERLLGGGDWIVVSAIPVQFDHPRFVDWSRLSTSFERLIYLISQADVVLCVDTCVYHIADAVNTPAVVLFNTVRPDYRAAYYPHVRSLMVGGDGHGGLIGRSSSDEPADLDAAARMWSELDLDHVIAVLEGVVVTSEHNDASRCARHVPYC